ncbi:MAG: hypothetical protein CMQ84_06195 [Gammaproteobacteria bacterium]|nr:hypothetical protein [Gammaproteobacteria bacterium]OUX77581.1 MAG: hypothetical protein CBC19_07075 [Oceanospirillales bacterium TMED59]|tara:strand:+ start:1525 stop:1779 length:255 start_codon:yes stop_codon:yes gene_type:complete
MTQPNDSDTSGENEKAVEDLKKSAEIKDREIDDLKKRVEDEKQLNQIHLSMIRELQAQLTSQSRLGMVFLCLLLVSGIIIFGFS